MEKINKMLTGIFAAEQEKIRRCKMLKYILRKGLSLAVALVFAITTIAQAAPVSAQRSYLRPQPSVGTAAAENLFADLQSKTEQVTGTKSSPAITITDKKLQELQVLSNYSALDEIFGKEKKDIKQAIHNAMEYYEINSPEDIIKGMFYDGVPEGERAKTIRTLVEMRRGPPPRGNALAFGGGTALLPTIEALRKLKYFVKSIQSSIDDGGATFILIYRLVEAKYGRIPSVGDLASSLYKGGASAAKLYKLLDDQGRIALLGDAIDKLRKKGQVKEDSNDIVVLKKDKETEAWRISIEEFNNNKKSIAVYDERGAVIKYVKTCEELVTILLGDIYKAVKDEKGLGYTEEERAENKEIGKDFAFFAATVLNIARLVDKKYFQVDPKTQKSIVPMKGASIRNLMLLAALDYLGVLKQDKDGTLRDNIWEAAIKTNNDKELFQLALDALATSADIKDLQVMLSHYDPATVCAIYDGNVILINQGKHNREDVIHALTVKVDPETKKTQVALNEELKPKIKDLETGESGSFIIDSPLGSIRVEFSNDHGIVTFKINNSEECTITESDAGPEITYAVYQNEKHIVAQDGTGRVKYKHDRSSYGKGLLEGQNLPDKDSPEVRAAIKEKEEQKRKNGLPIRAEDEGLSYYAPLEMAGMKVYIRSRFVAMQTNATETATFSPLSKIIAFGNTLENPIMPEEKIFEPTTGKVNTQYYYKRDLSQRSEANEKLIYDILSDKTRIIIFGPGSYFTSIIPHLMAKGVIEALAERCRRNDIPIVFVLNPNLDGETAGYDLMRIIRFIEEVTGILTDRRYRIGEIFNTLVVNGIDTVKLQEYALGRGFLEKEKTITAKECRKLLEDNPSLLEDLKLDYIKFLINRFLERATTKIKTGRERTAEYYARRSYANAKRNLDDEKTRYVWAISHPGFSNQKFYINNDDDKPLKDEWDVATEGQMSILRYIELKLYELQKTLYERPDPEIRIERAAASKEAKKSRGPIPYSREVLDTIRAENPDLVIYEGYSPVGVGMTSPREPGADIGPHIGFIQELYNSVIAAVNNRNVNLLDNRQEKPILQLSLGEAIKVVRTYDADAADTLEKLTSQKEIEVLDLPVKKVNLVLDRYQKNVFRISLSRSMVLELSSVELATVLVGLVKGKLTFENLRNLEKAKAAEKVAYNEFTQAAGIKLGSPSSVKTSPAGEGFGISAKLHKTLKGHRSSVLSVAFSPDGKKIATAGIDDEARIWDAETGKCLHILEGHKDSVNSALFSPDGKRIVTASNDYTARIWDAETGECLRTIYSHPWEYWDADKTEPKSLGQPQQYGVNSASFSPDGKRIVTASNDSGVRIWDAETGKFLKDLGEFFYTAFHSASFSPDGKRVAAITTDHKTRVWRVWDEEKIDKFGGALLSERPHPYDYYNDYLDPLNRMAMAPIPYEHDFLNSVLFSPDGKRIVTVTNDGTITIWEAEKGYCLKILKPTRGHIPNLNSASFSPDGKMIVTTGQDQKVRIWDAETGKCLKVLHRYTDIVVKSASFSPDGKRIAVARGNGSIQIWSLSRASSAAKSFPAGEPKGYFGPGAMSNIELPNRSFSEAMSILSLPGLDMTAILKVAHLLKDIIPDYKEIASEEGVNQEAAKHNLQYTQDTVTTIDNIRLARRIQALEEAKPEFQTPFALLIDKTKPYASQLEIAKRIGELNEIQKRLNCKIIEFDPQTDDVNTLIQNAGFSPDRAIAISSSDNHDKLKKANVKLIAIEQFAQTQYFDLASLAAFSKCMLYLAIYKDHKDMGKIKNYASLIYRNLTGAPLTEDAIRAYMADFIISLSLPTPEVAYKEGELENLHRQAMAALIAA